MPLIIIIIIIINTGAFLCSHNTTDVLSSSSVSTHATIALGHPSWDLCRQVHGEELKCECPTYSLLRPVLSLDVFCAQPVTWTAGVPLLLAAVAEQWCLARGRLHVTTVSGDPALTGWASCCESSDHALGASAPRGCPSILGAAP